MNESVVSLWIEGLMIWVGKECLGKEVGGIGLCGIRVIFSPNGYSSTIGVKVYFMTVLNQVSNIFGIIYIFIYLFLGIFL